jgi:hypothetical protein
MKWKTPRFSRIARTRMWLGGALIFASLSAISAPCPPGEQINSPDAGRPTDTDFTALLSDANQREKFLMCPFGQLAKAGTKSFKLGSVASKDPFNVAVHELLSNPSGGSRRLEVAAQAIHVRGLLKDSSTRSGLLNGFPSAWEKTWCEAARSPRRNPLEVPETPDLEVELLDLRPMPIRVAREVAADMRPLPKLDCAKAIRSWLDAAVQ